MKSSGVVGGVTDPSVEAYLRDANTSLGKAHRMSALGSFHYSYKSKYVLDFTLRADGSTKFGKNNRWGFFPGVSGRWNISDEPFILDRMQEKLNERMMRDEELEIKRR